jgi:hypothetical protein
MPDQGSISTGMYPITPAQPANPLAMLHSFAQTQNLLNQNAIFQQEFAARKAIGPILQQSIDPHSGELDIGKFAVGAAHNQATAWKLPEIMMQMIQRKYMQAETAQKELQIAQSKYGAIGQAMSGLWGRAVDAAGNDTSINPHDGLPNRVKVSHGELVSAVAPLIGSGVVSAKEAVNYFNGMSNGPKVRDPATGEMITDPRWLAAHVKQFADSSRSVNETLATTENAITPYTAGGQTQLARTSPRTGAITPQGAIQHSLTPEQLAARVEYQDPKTGEIKANTLGNMLKSGVPLGAVSRFVPAGETQGGAAPGAARMPNLTESNARIVPGPGEPGEMAPGIPNAQDARPGGGPGAGMPQGVPEGAFPLTTRLNPADETALKELPTLQSHIDTSAANATRMNQVIDALEAAQRRIKTGGGAEFYMRAAQIMQGMGLKDEIVDKVANGSLPASQEYQKLFLQLSTALLRASLMPGGGESSAGRLTNMEFSAFQKNNPDINTDPRAVKEMFAFMRRMNHISYQQQQAFNAVRATRGDVWAARNFNPWFNERVIKSGAVSLGTAEQLGLRGMHPGGER